jgi:excinuclease ABC subunit C
MLISYIVEFYSLDNSLIPSEVLIPYIEDLDLLKDLLGTKVYIPIKGIKKQLVELVKENAKNNLDNIQKERLIKISKTTKTLEELASLLNIKYPRVIELFDNSNIQGASSVSAMVTYIDGMPSYKDYRKYKIKTIEGADDYHTMQEVSKRRYTRVLKENLRKPNLIIADGGKTQVKAIQEVLDELNIQDIDLIGLVKDDKHRTRAIVNSCGEEIAIDKKSNLFLLLESMQNEVHRFAITFFLKVHTESLLSSRLDTIDGIGKKRKQILLEHFDSIEAIKKATIEELHFLGFSKDLSEKLLKSLNE